MNPHASSHNAAKDERKTYKKEIGKGSDIIRASIVKMWQYLWKRLIWVFLVFCKIGGK